MSRPRWLAQNAAGPRRSRPRRRVRVRVAARGSVWSRARCPRDIARVRGHTTQQPVFALSFVRSSAPSLLPSRSTAPGRAIAGRGGGGGGPARHRSPRRAGRPCRVARPCPEARRRPRGSRTAGPAEEQGSERGVRGPRLARPRRRCLWRAQRTRTQLSPTTTLSETRMAWTTQLWPILAKDPTRIGRKLRRRAPATHTVGSSHTQSRADPFLSLPLPPLVLSSRTARRRQGPRPAREVAVAGRFRLRPSPRPPAPRTRGRPAQPRPARFQPARYSGNQGSERASQRVGRRSRRAHPNTSA